MHIARAYGWGMGGSPHQEQEPPDSHTSHPQSIITPARCANANQVSCLRVRAVLHGGCVLANGDALVSIAARLENNAAGGHGGAVASFGAVQVYQNIWPTSSK
jgi:hypothetical protein